MALMTGIDAVEMALRSWTNSHFWRQSAKTPRLSIIFSRSGRYKLVTAMSISLDSRARPVTSDPNCLILGDKFYLLWLSLLLSILPTFFGDGVEWCFN